MLMNELYLLGELVVIYVLIIFCNNNLLLFHYDTISDAAHTIHPLAGQGLNQGLADVQCLSKVIEYGVTTGQDLGKLYLFIHLFYFIHFLISYRSFIIVILFHEIKRKSAVA